MTMSLEEFIEREDLIEEQSREIRHLRNQLSQAPSKPCSSGEWY